MFAISLLEVRIQPNIISPGGLEMVLQMLMSVKCKMETPKSCQKQVAHIANKKSIAEQNLHQQLDAVKILG